MSSIVISLHIGKRIGHFHQSHTGTNRILQRKYRRSTGEQPALLGFRISPRMVVLGPATKIPGYFSQFTIPDEFWRLIQLRLFCRQLLVGLFHKSEPIPRFDLYTPAWLGFATND